MTYINKSFAYKEGRLEKAKQIYSVLSKYKDVNKCRILEIGVGSGEITSYLGTKSKSMYGVDIYDTRLYKNNYRFTKLEFPFNLPYPSKSFDIVISNHVIEHNQNQQELINEWYRVLKHAGILYLATPNKFWFLEPHYKIPFLSYFDDEIAGGLLMIINNGYYNIHPLDYKRLHKLTFKFKSKDNVSLDIMDHPEEFNIIQYKSVSKITRKLPKFILKKMVKISPSIIMVCRK